MKFLPGNQRPRRGNRNDDHDRQEFPLANKLNWPAVSVASASSPHVTAVDGDDRRCRRMPGGQSSPVFSDFLVGVEIHDDNLACSADILA